MAVCNRSKDKAIAFATKAGIELTPDSVVTDYKLLVSRSDIDALVVCAPVNNNLEIVQDAVNHGKHIIVEKPIAHNLEDAAKIVEISREHAEKLVVMVAENYPYKESLQEMAKLVAGTCCVGLIVSTSQHHFI